MFGLTGTEKKIFFVCMIFALFLRLTLSFLQPITGDFDTTRFDRKYSYVFTNPNFSPEHEADVPLAKIRMYEKIYQKFYHNNSTGTAIFFTGNRG